MGTDNELSGIDSLSSCRKNIIDNKVVISVFIYFFNLTKFYYFLLRNDYNLLILLPNAIFSPLSGGKANPKILMNDMKTHGNTKLKMK